MNQDDKKKVLFADDDQIVHILGKASLEEAGFEVRLLDSGVDVIPAFNEFNPDIVILDINLPDKNGIALCSEIRATEQGKIIPILMITGLNTLDIIQQCYEAGATDFETKPINWLILGQKLRFLLSANEQFRAIIHQSILNRKNDIETSSALIDVSDDSVSFNSLILENIQMLEKETGKTILQNLLMNYLEEIPSFISLLREAIKSVNSELLLSCSFYIRTKSENIGAVKMTQHCLEIEAHSKSKAKGALSEIHEALCAEFASIEKQIRDGNVLSQE